MKLQLAGGVPGDVAPDDGFGRRDGPGRRIEPGGDGVVRVARRPRRIDDPRDRRGCGGARQRAEHCGQYGAPDQGHLRGNATSPTIISPTDVGAARSRRPAVARANRRAARRASARTHDSQRCAPRRRPADAAWFHPRFLRTPLARVAVVALLALKALGVATITPDGWCVRFEPQRPLVKDATSSVPHSWDVRSRLAVRPAGVLGDRPHGPIRGSASFRSGSSTCRRPTRAGPTRSIFRRPPGPA